MDKKSFITKWQRRIKHPINSFRNLDTRTPVPDPFRYLDNKIGKAISWMNNTFVIKDGYTPENGGTINNRLREQQQQARQNKNQQQNNYKTPELTGSRELYLNRLKQQGFTARPTTIKNNNPQQDKTSNITFKQAFNNARNSGLKEFTWGGKRFNTKNKGEENYIFSNGKWINPNIKFTVSSVVEPTKEEMDELNRKAKPIGTWEGASLAKNGGTLKSHKSVIQRFRERK